MISIHQKGFVKGRHILDVVIIAHELVHSMKNNKIPSMAFKLDISKAYDRVSCMDLPFQIPREVWIQR